VVYNSTCCRDNFGNWHESVNGNPRFFYRNVIALISAGKIGVVVRKKSAASDDRSIILYIVSVEKLPFFETRYQVVKTTFTIQVVAFKMTPIRVEKSKISRFLDVPHLLAPTPSFFIE
jgi:hypothetical protein